MTELAKSLGYEYHIPSNGWHNYMGDKLIEMEWLIYLSVGIEDNFKTIWSCILRISC